MIVKDTTEHRSVLGKGETKCLLRLHSSAYDSVPNGGSCCHPDVHLASGFPRTAACSTNKDVEDCQKFPEAVPSLSCFIDLQQLSLKQVPPGTFPRDFSTRLLNTDRLHPGDAAPQTSRAPSLSRSLQTSQDRASQPLANPQQPQTSLLLFILTET